MGETVLSEPCRSPLRRIYRSLHSRRRTSHSPSTPALLPTNVPRRVTLFRTALSLTRKAGDDRFAVVAGPVFAALAAASIPAAAVEEAGCAGCVLAFPVVAEGGGGVGFAALVLSDEAAAADAAALAC